MTGWAHHRHLGSLHGAGPGRLPLGRVGLRRVSLPPLQSLLVLGQTRSGKTTRLAAPALTSWHGPAVVTSIRRDLLSLTITARQTGNRPTWVFDPTDFFAARWSPLDGCGDWRRAMQMASWLTEVAYSGSDRDADWAGWAEKMLAPMLHAAARADLTMAAVARWLDTRDWRSVAKHLPTDPAGPAEAWTASISRPEKQQGSILSVAESILKVFADPGVAEATSKSEFTVAELLAANGTLYIVSPAHEQARLRPIFTALLRSVLNYAVDQGPLDPPLLLVLDEIANIAPLEDLPQIASTCAGEGIQLVTVFQDGSQIKSLYRDLAESIWTNHPARVVLPSGMLDMDTLDRLARLLGEEAVAQRNPSGTITTSRRQVATADELYQMPRGVGVLLSGSCPPARLILAKS